MRGHRAIKGLARIQAVVAAAAVGFGVGLAEIVEECGAAAGGQFRVAHHAVELRARMAALLGIRLLVDEANLLHHIARAEEQQTLRGQAVATGAARLLIVALDIFRQIVMHDEAHVRLIDPHAKGDGRADDAHFIAEKSFLIRGPRIAFEAGVIRRRRNSFPAQTLRDALRRLPALAVHDARLARPLAQEGHELIKRTRLRDHAVAQVRAIEAGYIDAGVTQVELLQDVRPDARRSGGSERHERHAREALAQRGELAVFRTEVVPPFADAVRFIDGDLRHLPLAQIVEKARQHQPLGGGVEQLVLPLPQAAQASARVIRSERGVEKSGRDSARRELVHLILHQRDERRDDDRQTITQQGWELKAERLSAARGQQREDVAARERIGNDLLLKRSEGLVTEDAFERGKQGRHWGKFQVPSSKYQTNLNEEKR